MEEAIKANKAPALPGRGPHGEYCGANPGCWNINDIYSPNELVKEGKLVKKENGQYVAPATPSPTTPKFAPHFLLVCVFSEKCRPTWGGISRLSRKGAENVKIETTDWTAGSCG